MRDDKSPLRTALIAGLVAVFVLCGRTLAQQPATTAARPEVVAYVKPTKAHYLKLADEVEATLHRDVLDVGSGRTASRRFPARGASGRRPITTAGPC
jgi:hypothetical protein